jgi:hypothetical protein
VPVNVARVLAAICLGVMMLLWDMGGAWKFGSGAAAWCAVELILTAARADRR